MTARSFKPVHVFEIRASKAAILTTEDASHDAALRCINLKYELKTTKKTNYKSVGVFLLI